MKTIKMLTGRGNNKVAKIMVDDMGYYTVMTLINTDQVVGNMKSYKTEKGAFKYANNFLND